MKERTVLEQWAYGLGRALLGFIVVALTLGALASCGPRMCKVVELVPDGKGGVTVNCDGEPWGVGTRFEDQRKRKGAPDGR